jgi:endonuclease/exonuclease/phosphatase family metal-dependent hydrolase
MTGTRRSSPVIPFLLMAVVPLIIGCNRHPASDKTVALGTLHGSDTLRIGFYNVENLFDLHDDGGEYPEYRPGALGWNKQTWQIKFGNIASVIVALNVDIIGLCEVENRNALEELRKSIRERGTDYPYGAVADLSGRGATCTALLSRYPVVKSDEFDGASESSGRPILEADVDCGGTAFKLFVNHWPSKKHPESLRLAAARALVRRLQRLPPQTDYAIIGDLNSDYDEWREFRTEGLDDTRGRTGINHVLKTVHGGPGNFVSYVARQEMAAADSAWHYDLWFELPERQRWSLTYQGQRKTPDHILLPRSLFDRNGWSYLEGSFSSFTWENRLLKNGEPFRWQMKGFGTRRFHAGEGYSDHLPLLACFIKKKPDRAADGAADSIRFPKPGIPSAGQGGFETSMEGWLACGRGIDASRDSSQPASGRWCLRIQGTTPEKNCCAARAVLRRAALNRSRWAEFAFDLRGSGKLSLRVRSGKGRWRYYNGPAFSPAGSPKYLPVNYTSWKHIALTFTCDNLSSADLAMEFRAGKNAPFCFYLDNVVVQ